MSHSSGLAGWREPVSVEDLRDVEKVTALLAAQAPFWKPGSASGYHAATQGYLVAEVVRRITGRSLGTVFREEIAEPLGADFHIGLPNEIEGRIVDLIPPPVSPVADEELTELQAMVARNPQIDGTADQAWRGAEIPIVGTGNARSIAEIHAILANGGVAGGKRFLSEAGCRKALEPQIEGRDLVLGIPVRFGLGFAIGNWMPNPNTLYWGGMGGSLAVIDLDARTTFAYAMNRMSGTATGDVRGLGLAMAMWEGADPT